MPPPLTRGGSVSYTHLDVYKRQVYGITFEQGRNELAINADTMLTNWVTENKNVTEEQKRDLIIALILSLIHILTSTVKGKRVVLVDDSIVRGTTSARIIKLLRDAGAAEVHFMVSAPPFKYPCYFGTDIPDQKLLVATGRTLEQIKMCIRDRSHPPCCPISACPSPPR